MSPSSFIDRQPNARSVYERQRQEECQDYEQNFEGDLNALFCIVTSASVSERMRDALNATAERAGFSRAETIWITTTNVAVSLEAPDLMKLVEVIDPLCMVVLDQHAAELLSKAYNQPIKLEACDFILGRPCACFVDFSRMLETDERKQRAWALMKEMLSYLNEA